MGHDEIAMRWCLIVGHIPAWRNLEDALLRCCRIALMCHTLCATAVVRGLIWDG